MSNTNSNYQAAGTAATTARGSVKESWYKKPVILNIIIATVVIILMLIINANYQFNFFWKLVVGVALIWGGGKLVATKVSPATLWGNILKGVGWLVLILALMGSGVRHFTEGTVNWINTQLSTVWTDETEVKTGSSKLMLSTGPMVATYVFRGLAEGPKKEVVDRTGRMEIHFQPPSRATWYVCGRVVGPAIVRSHGGKPDVELKTLSAPPGWHYFEFTEGFVDFLKENDVRAPLLVEFTLREAVNGVVPATCPK